MNITICTNTTQKDLHSSTELLRRGRHGRTGRNVEEREEGGRREKGEEGRRDKIKRALVLAL